MKKVIICIIVGAIGVMLWLNRTKTLSHSVSLVPFTGAAPILPQKREESRAAVTIQTLSHWEPEARLGEFLRIQRKALATPEERNVYEKLLTDPELIDRAGRTLMSSPQSTTDLRTERMSAVEYLATSLLLEGNPEQGRILKTVNAFLLSPQPGTLQQARYVAADKAELYSALTSFLPAEAKLIDELAKGTPNAKVFQFSRGFFNLNQDQEKI